MAERSSFKIGGKAALLAEPADEEALAFVLAEIKKAGIPYFVLGGGTNVLFDDAGYDGIIVSTKKLSDISVIKDCPVGTETEGKTIIRAAAGASMAALVSFAERQGLTGLEEFAGLPGTVGGAVYMNARCFDKEISEVAAAIRWLEPDLAPREAVFAPSDWAYKKSPFTGTGRVVLSAQFVLKKGSSEECAKRGAAFIQERKDKGHYKAPCAGSVFKNNRALGRPTGKIIDELGLKGERRGGAQIAPFHGNIIINAGGATSADVRALIDLCKSKALERFGFKLEEEIILA